MNIEINESASIAVGFVGFFTAVACIAMFGCHQCEETNRESERTTQEAMKSGLVQKPEIERSILIWTKP